MTAPDALYDDRAERAVLGAALIRPAALDDLTETLEPWHFRRAAHQTIFGAMLALQQRNAAVDPVTVCEQIARAGTPLDDMGGPAYVSSLTDGVPASSHYAHYAAIVRDKALLRALRDEARRVQAEAEGALVSGAELLERAEQALYRLGSRAVQSEWVSGEQLATELYPVIERIAESHRGVTGLSTGLPDLDAMTRGLQPGDLVLIGARPGSGKTAIGLQIAMKAAESVPVAFFSVEMGRQPIGLRSVIAAAHVDGFRFLSGYLSDLEHMRVGDGLSRLAAAQIYIDESPYLSPLHVRAKLRRLNAKLGRVGLVVIDYLQLMAPLPDDRRENKTNQVAGISRALKVLAREFGAPFLVLAQLNRGLERSADKRPTLSDLRDSGALEQDADLVLLLHRPEMYERDKPELEGVAELIVGKQRNGPTGTVDLYFRKAEMRFESRAR